MTYSFINCSSVIKMIPKSKCCEIYALSPQKISTNPTKK